jgi:hypothetical protein
MKTTRRGWLTAISSLIALPLLPKSGAATAESTAESRSLVDHFAGLPYRNVPDSWAGKEFWEETVRVPVTTAELQAREESLRDDLHYLRSRSAGHYATTLLETELREIDTARALLAQLPTGRPVTFRYTNGSTPGQSRTVLPTLVFHTEPPFPPGLEILGEITPAEFHESRHLYLQAYCLERLAPRTFRLDRIQNPTPLA